MAPTAKIDHLSELRAKERYGVVTGLVRKARVVDLVSTDYLALKVALDTLGLAVYSGLDGFPANLLLVERNPTLVPDQKDAVDVELVYESTNRNQPLNAPPFGFIISEVSATINQTTSNKDAQGTQIVLQHTYPGDDPHFPGETKEQGGEIQYYEPQRNIKFSGIKVTPFPWLLQKALVGSINGNAWYGSPAYEWMCISCTFEPLVSEGPNTWKMTFEFQHNPDTWNPTCYFIDEITQKPPADLVEGTGFKTIRKHSAVNFEQLIGARLQGG